MWEKIFGHETNKIFLGNMLQGERKHLLSFFMVPTALARKNLPLNLPGAFSVWMIPPMMTATAAAAALLTGKAILTSSM